VSNILDANYVGIHGVLTLWGPLLADTRSAAIIGYFMNWATVQESGRAFCTGEASKDLVSTVMDKNKVSPKELKHWFSEE